ncbi:MULTISPECIES: metal-dependent hydrolase [unclassified Moraxella]|uniref:metal-dependent hydrolase n=1 Tax=unclassified Moraxella TaxID=2685852 RepID=UPI003AF9F2A4
MANFNTHLTGAFVSSGIMGLVVYKAGMLVGSEFLLCSVVGTIGGLLPDIDLEHSVPARIGFNVLSLLLAFGMVIYWSPQLSLVELMITWLLTYIIMRWGVFTIFSSMTVHRGIVHSVPYMAVLALSLVYISFYLMKYTVVFSWFMGLFLFFGSMVHLLLDEMYSVNVFGLRLKKSFGTAIKFFDTQQKSWYIGLYLVLAILLIFAPSYRVFWQTLSDPISWALLQQNLLPAGMSLPNIPKIAIK